MPTVQIPFTTVLDSDGGIPTGGSSWSGSSPSGIASFTQDGTPGHGVGQRYVVWACETPSLDDLPAEAVITNVVISGHVSAFVSPTQFGGFSGFCQINLDLTHLTNTQTFVINDLGGTFEGDWSAQGPLFIVDDRASFITYYCSAPSITPPVGPIGYVVAIGYSNLGSGGAATFSNVVATVSYFVPNCYFNKLTNNYFHGADPGVPWVLVDCPAPIVIVPTAHHLSVDPVFGSINGGD